MCIPHLKEACFYLAEYFMCCPESETFSSKISMLISFDLLKASVDWDITHIDHSLNSCNEYLLCECPGHPEVNE